MFFDFHTHRPAGTALVSAEERPECSPYWSLQFHPWDLPEDLLPLPEDFYERLSSASALGEIGLDRLKGPALSLQRKYFSLLLAAAEKTGKPVVIHSVRCDAELDTALSSFPGRVLIHGFRGSVRKLQHHLELGRFVSFAPGAWRGHIDFLRTRGLKGIGLETDDNTMYISDVYCQAEEETGIPAWEQICEENFFNFIG